MSTDKTALLNVVQDYIDAQFKEQDKRIHAAAELVDSANRLLEALANIRSLPPRLPPEPTTVRYIIWYAAKDEERPREFLAVAPHDGSTYRDAYEVTRERAGAATFPRPEAAMLAHARFISDEDKAKPGWLFVSCPRLERA